MNKTRGMWVVAAAFGFMLNSGALAQQGDSSSQLEELKQLQEDLNKEVSGLKQELTAIKSELKGLRGEMAKAVAAMKSGPKKQPRQRPAMTMLGKKAPEVKLTTVDGAETSIGGKRDKPQVLFCYASWCGYCKKSLPWMETLHKKYKDQGVEVLAVNLDARGEGGRSRTEEQTLTHFKGMNLTLPMTMTTATNNTAKIGTTMKAQSFPTLFVVGASGVVESVHIGAKAGLEKIIGAELDLLLQGKTRADFPK